MFVSCCRISPMLASGKDILSGASCYDVSGNMSVDYNGLDTALFGSRIVTLAWTEVRDFDF